MTKLIDLEKSFATVQTEAGPQRKDVYISGELGIIESMAPVVEHPLTYRIVHVPSGAMIRFQIFHNEADACAAMAALNRLRNTWDFMSVPTQGEQTRMARRFHEIAEDNGMCVDCVEHSINRNNALRKSGERLKFGGVNGYSAPEPSPIEEKKP